MDQITTADQPASHPGLSEQLRDKLLRSPVAGLTQQMQKRGEHNATIDAVAPVRPGSKLVGVARTLRFIPQRADLQESHGGGYNAHKRLIDTVNPGEVIVMEARGVLGSGTLGDVMALRAQVRGCAGVVTDGAVRDSAEIAALELPVFSAGAAPANMARDHVPWEADLTISCGGAAVQPGDIIVADDDGALVLPPHLAQEVADAALAKEAEDEWVVEQVKQGHSVDGLFPMNAQWRERFEAETGGAE